MQHLNILITWIVIMVDSTSQSFFCVCVSFKKKLWWWRSTAYVLSFFHSKISHQHHILHKPHSVDCIYVFINIIYDIISIVHRCERLCCCCWFSLFVSSSQYHEIRLLAYWDMISDNSIPFNSILYILWEIAERQFTSWSGEFSAFIFDTMFIINIYSLLIMNCI